MVVVIRKRGREEAEGEALARLRKRYLFSFFLSPAFLQGDIVLLGMRDYQEDKVDIIHKYNADEARNLKAFGELPETGTSFNLFAYI